MDFKFIIKHYYEAIKEIWKLASEIIGLIIGLLWGTLYLIYGIFLSLIIFKNPFKKKNEPVK